jgi:pimeloyl-ACP methyl ester carboxylesterase
VSRRSEIVTLDGRSIETYIDGSGPTVVIIPSYGRDAGDDFDLFTAALVDAGYRVLRPQPRGIGQSSGPMADVVLDDLGEDVAQIIDRLVGGPAAVLGHAFGNFVARCVATNHPDKVAAVILAAAAGRNVPAEINSAPMRAGDPTLPKVERLAALRQAFFAPGHDASIWLTGWYPDTLKMQSASIHGVDMNRLWAAGTAPIFEIIASLDPFHERNQWGDLRAQFGARVASTVIEDASHALFPEQPAAIAEAVIHYLLTLPRI